MLDEIVRQGDDEYKDRARKMIGDAWRYVSMFGRGHTANSRWGSQIGDVEII